MKTENWSKISEILSDCLEIEVSKRRKFLDELGISSEIRAEVETYLAFEEDVEGLMNISAVEFSSDFFTDDGDSANALVGQSFGAYKVVRELGYGGMGAVYLAERADGKFEQKVALKLLKREINTAALRRRFGQEREILASLQHPNIAGLLDAGTTADKIPYIAMEYVEGVPIDDYCSKHNLDLEQRLDLFRKVCEAVGFAHRNLIVHRDLKPSNILVTKDGIPKLLDFGISKIISAELEQLNSATITKLGVMTPGYASPEQLQRKSVTTATDIYSLGVILYELLSGHRPFESKEDDLKEIYKAIIETDPPLPSSMAATVSKEFKEKTEAATVIKSQEENEELIFKEDTKRQKKNSVDKTEVGKMRQTNPQSVNLNSQSIRGDLDNIILKALRKEPERRYSSAENFSADIKRHLRGLPVTARPNTLSYRAEKFFKRNKASVVAGIFILLAIVAGIFATLWQARVAQAERDRAVLEAKKSEKINAYMQKILNFSNPHWLSSNPERNSNAKISDALNEALKNIDADLKDEPEIQAEILFTIGQTYVSQGQFDKADKLLKQAIEKFDEVYGKGNPKSMQTSVVLGDTKLLTGKLDEAEKFYLSAIDYFRPKVSEDKNQNKWLAIALTDLGNIYLFKGKYQEAEAVNKESLELSKKLSGSDGFIIPIVLGNLGAIKTQTGDYQNALDYYEQALNELKSMGNEQKFESGNIHLYTGITNIRLGNFKDAEVSLKKAYDILSKTGGEENVYALSAKYHTANNYFKQGKYAEAETILTETIDKQKKVFPNGHFTIAYSQRLLGDVYTKINDLKKGETEIRAALAMLSKTAKEPNPEIAVSKESLGNNLLAQKRFEEGKIMLESALENFSKTKGEEHPDFKRVGKIIREIPN